ncbi:MAG: acyltransferase [Limisphaerales bacterium]
MKPAKSNRSKHWLDAWHVNPSVNRDYDFIDGLRGVAILMVLTGHHFYVNPQSGPVVEFIGAFFSAGGHGVMLFFALSGFLISWPFWKRKFGGSASVVPPGYGWRRFWKIYPPLALSVLVFTPIYVFANQDWSYCAVAAQWLVGIPFLLPVSGKLNPVTWTLVIEVQFYIVLALIFLSLKKISPRVCLWIIPLLFFLVPVGFRALTGLSATFYPDINPHFPSALDAFCLGILVAGLENAGVMQKSWARLGVIGLILWPLALLGVAWLQTHPASKDFATLEVVGWLEKAASAMLLCYVASPQHPVAQWLCAPWLRWCGIVSYEWYLFHQPITLWARNFFGPAGGDFFKYAAIVGSPLLISLLLTALIYRFFSLPILKYGRASANKK